MILNIKTRKKANFRFFNYERQKRKGSIVNYRSFAIATGIRKRDPDLESGSTIRKNAGSGSGTALNQCGSETLLTGH
jgi:hypothetical protein